MINLPSWLPARSRAIVRALSELVRALDRRVPHLERSSETGIAKDARRLRDEAVQRIDTLTNAAAERAQHDAAAHEEAELRDGKTAFP